VIGVPPCIYLCSEKCQDCSSELLKTWIEFGVTDLFSEEWTSSINGDITGNHGFNDYWVVKLSDSGILEWQKALGGSNEDYARAICQAEDGRSVVSGYKSKRIK
jgi:hypothetical protein